MQEILSFLEQRQDEMVQALLTLVEHESPSHDKAANDSLALHLANLFPLLTGGTVNIIANAQHGNHVRAEWNPQKTQAPQILLLGHFDTVWQQGTLQQMPFRIEDGKAFGPGTFDMKGGIVQGLYAIHALSRLQRSVGCKVVFLMTSDEEIGSFTSREIIKAEAAQSRCVFVLEPGAGPHGALKTSRKGVGNFQMDIEGISAHAGLEPQKGRSAIEELARQITYLHSLSDHERGTTINVGIIEGGTASNVVAAKASAEIDLRVCSQADADDIVPRILGTQPFLEGTRITMTGDVNRPPLERTEEGVALYQLACCIAQQELGFAIPETSVGGASDGNFTAHLAPTLDGLGAMGDGAHATHEHVLIDEMPRRSALLARLIEEVSQDSYATKN